MKQTTVFCVWLLMAACAGSTDRQMSERTGTDGGDSVVCQLEKDRIHSRVVALRPSSDLAQPVGEWLSEALGGYYPGDATDLQAMADFYAEAMADTLRVFADENPDPSVEFAFEAEMSKLYETDRYVTYQLDTYYDLGGVHPTSGCEGVTFRKNDGRRLGWDIISRNLRYEFNEMLKRELMDYFQVETDEALEALLFDISAYKIPLPQTPPYLTDEGLAFIYQQYEIAAYAYGMPSGVFSAERISPLLTAWGRELLKEAPSR